ncbi:MAG: hypothetical protein QXX84_06930 [Sulfolobales archaeon]
MVKELGGGYLSPAYEEIELVEPASGAGIPVGALLKRTSSGYEFVRTEDAEVKIAGVVASVIPRGDGAFSCVVLKVGVWSGVVYEWNTSTNVWVTTTRHRTGVLQVPVYVV